MDFFKLVIFYTHKGDSTAFFGAKYLELHLLYIHLFFHLQFYLCNLEMAFKLWWFSSVFILIAIQWRSNTLHLGKDLISCLLSDVSS